MAIRRIVHLRNIHQYTGVPKNRAGATIAIDVDSINNIVRAAIAITSKADDYCRKEGVLLSTQRLNERKGKIIVRRPTTVMRFDEPAKNITPTKHVVETVTTQGNPEMYLEMGIEIFREEAHNFIDMYLEGLTDHLVIDSSLIECVPEIKIDHVSQLKRSQIVDIVVKEFRTRFPAIKHYEYK